jgi:hypothetical protein
MLFMRNRKLHTEIILKKILHCSNKTALKAVCSYRQVAKVCIYTGLRLVSLS